MQGEIAHRAARPRTDRCVFGARSNSTPAIVQALIAGIAAREMAVSWSVTRGSATPVAARISSREASSWLVTVGYLWLIVFGARVALTEMLDGPSAAVGIVVAAVVVVACAAGYLLADRIWSGRPIDIWLPAIAPVFAVLGAAGVLVSGRNVSAAGLGVPAIVVVASLVYRDAAAWRGLAGARRTAVPEPVAAPAPAAKPIRLTPSDRAARFTAEVFALDAAQLETMIESWAGLDPEARSAAWDAARPYLAGADRKDLLAEVREELKRWAAGEGHSEGAPTQEIETILRHRANRALIDAAAGVIAQDRMTKHDFDILYAPFRSALTGEPLKIARRSARSADRAATRSSRAKRNTPLATDDALEPSDEAELPPLPAPAGRD